MKNIKENDVVNYKGVEYKVLSVDTVDDNGIKDKTFLLENAKGKRIVLALSELMVLINQETITTEIEAERRNFRITDGNRRKSDIIKRVAESEGLEEEKAKEIIELIFRTMSNVLITGEPIGISSFGKFGVVETPAKVGVNPATGEKIYLPATNVVKFKQSPLLKDLIDPNRDATVEIGTKVVKKINLFDAKKPTVKEQSKTQVEQWPTPTIEATPTEQYAEEFEIIEPTTVYVQQPVVPQQVVIPQPIVVENKVVTEEIVSQQIVFEQSNKTNYWFWFITSMFVGFILVFLLLKIINGADHGSMGAEHFFTQFSLTKISLSTEFIGYHNVADDVDWVADVMLLIFVPITGVLFLLTVIYKIFARRKPMVATLINTVKTKQKDKAKN